MTTEEKAKAYDDLLVKLQKAKVDNDVCDERYCCVIDDIVPELAESDDERIRKEIISALKYANHKGVYDKHLAWLEKQGEQNKWKPSKDEMDALYGLAYITNKMDDIKDAAIVKLYQDLKREFFNGSSYENMFPNTEDGVRRRSTIQVLEYARSLDNYNQYGKADIDKNIAWLEKQGEQETLCDKCRKAQPSHSCQDITELGRCYIEGERKVKDTTVIYHESGLKALEKSLEKGCTEGEQKPTDKVEPKFKVGDWVVQENIGTYKVVEVCESWYEVIDIQNKDYSIGFDKEYMCHIWTIQDAKPGDMLYCKSSGIEYIVMSKGVNESGNIDSYFRYNSLNGFGVDVPSVFSSRQDDITLANKEQRDFLFQKMKEAGYEWDAEKKELKKIEQKPTWSEEDEYNLLSAIKKLEKLAEDEKRVAERDNWERTYVLIDWLKSLKDRIGEIK